MEVYLYSIRWLYDNCEGGKMITSSGIIAADDMSDAVYRLTTDIYEGVEWIQLYALESSESGYADLNDINAVCATYNLISEE